MLDPRIPTVSRRFAVLSATLMILLPLGAVAYWALMPADQLASHWTGRPDAVAALPWGKRLASMALTMLGLLPMLFCLAALRRLFRLYAVGIIFRAENVAALNAIGTAMIWVGVVQVLAPTVIPLLLTFDNPAGHRMLVLGVGSGAVEALILGGVTRLIGWVMDGAREIADEQALTV